MADEVRFAADLFRGTAAAYERYRLPYPAAMTEDLARRAQVSGYGRLLDLACGTGQLAFALRYRFAEVWAVDQEPDMVEVVRAKTAAAEAPDFRPVVSSAETLDAPPDYFELAVVGNAFHRLDRNLAAGRIFRWLQPGGHLALCWSSQPWTGEQSWQRALAAALDRWKAALGAEHRIPAGWEEVRTRRPDSEVLSDAGFELAGNHEFTIEHRWTLPELAGLIRSTSFLPAAVLGDQAAAFDADLAASVGRYSDDDGAFTDTVSFNYELARKPDLRHFVSPRDDPGTTTKPQTPRRPADQAAKAAKVINCLTASPLAAGPTPATGARNRRIGPTRRSGPAQRTIAPVRAEVVGGGA